MVVLFFRVTATDIPDLTNVTNMSYMFSAINLNFDADDDVWNIPNIENWDVSNVTDMTALFNFCRGFNQDISNWDVSNVTSMNSMLRILRYFNWDISGWDVSKVTDMSNMFDFADNFNQDISSWDVSKVTDMSSMFKDAIAFNQEIGNWNVSNVTDMSYMFDNAENFNENIGNWDVSNVTDMNNMFKDANSFNQDITNWNTSKVTNMISMFENTATFNQNISGWDVGNVLSTNSMFENASTFNQNLEFWNIENVVEMRNMFDNSKLTKENYDAILNSWSKKNVKPNVFLGAASIKYCNSSQARQILISAPNNWTISDDGLDSSCNTSILIPDANFEQYLVDENIDSDATINGQILKSDIENVTTLLINDKNIADLTGIEGFTSLTELSAANNQISSIDLSKNISLEKLFIANNQLSTINVSNNLNLTNIDVGENLLTEIDVHLLTGLESLSIYKNQLTEINLFSNIELLAFLASDNQLKTVDFRVNKELNWVDLEDNSLENLNLKNENNSLILGSFFDVTGNPNLTCVEVDDVNYSETNWTNVDDIQIFNEECTPANDQCTNAIPLFVGQQIPGDINAGTSSTLTDCVDGNVIADVWYKVTVPQTGEFSVQGASTDGILKFALYETCSTATSVACGETISLTNQTVGKEFYLRTWLETTTSSKTSTTNPVFGEFTLQINESSVLSVNEDHVTKNNVKIYPNPANNLVSLSLKNKQSIQQVQLFNVVGKLVFNKNNTLEKLNIDVSNFSKGIYFLRIKTNNKFITKKLIIN